jgi:hypothetical protein
MKGAIYTTVCSFTIAVATLSIAQTPPTPGIDATRVVSASASPIYSRAALTGDATHYLIIQVKKTPLTQLSITLPDDISALQGVKTSRTGRHNWIYQVHGEAATADSVYLGSAEIQVRP